MELELTRRALVAAGLTDVTVRFARPDDPATPGAVVYAMAVGSACVIVERAGLLGPDHERIWGRRPDGHCLAK